MITDLLIAWNEKTAEIFNVHTSPPHDARRFAVIHIAFHNVLNSVKEKYKRYQYSEPIVSTASAEVALITAAKEVLTWAVLDCRKFVEAIPVGVQSPLKTNFSGAVANTHIQHIDELYVEQMAPFPLLDPNNSDGASLGHSVVDAITTIRDADGSIPIHMTSLMPDGEAIYKFRGDYYVPFPTSNEKLIVYYESVNPFVIDDNSMFQATFIESSLTDIVDVKDHGSKQYVENAQKVSIDDRNKIDYWSNLKQHYLWNKFTLELIKVSSLTDAWDIARLLALLHTAMADGTIAMFRVLYKNYHWRPSTAINFLKDVLPTDPNAWVPYKSQVPRVPEFPSVFGIFSGVAGTILNANFNNCVVTLDHKIDNNTTVQIVYSNIDDAAKDNADTKVKCGWNFKETLVRSITQGQNIGQYIMLNEFTLITPSSPSPSSHIPNIIRYPKWRRILDKSINYVKDIFKIIFSRK